MADTGLNFGGWILITLAWGFIISLTVFCFYKVLFGKSKNFNTQD